MNYYQPRQREDNGLWHYTRRNDDDIWPVAGCSPWVTCPECNGDSFYALREAGYPAPTDCARCENKGAIRSDDPCPGHDTPEGARRHAAEHVIEHTDMERAFETNWTDCRAEGCDAPTKKGVTVARPDGRMLTLCDAHLNRETVAAIVGDELGDMVSSY